MSIQLMTLAWNADLPTSQKFILLSLADQANDEGVCWPRIDLISFRCSVNRRTVQRALSDLEDSGYLQRHERPNRSTWYQLGIGADSKGLFPVAAGVGDTVSPQGGRQSVTPGGGTVSPQGRHSAAHNHHRTTTQPSSPSKPPRPKGRLAQSRAGHEAYPEAFEAVWRGYPKAKGGSKFDAGKAWEKLDPSEELAAQILADVIDRTKRDRAWRDGFVPHASTYLNQRRWTADIDTTEPRNGLDTSDRRDREAEDHLDNLAHQYGNLP